MAPERMIRLAGERLLLWAKTGSVGAAFQTNPSSLTICNEHLSDRGDQRCGRAKWGASHPARPADAR
jgi:hypothetical protein